MSEDFYRKCAHSTDRDLCSAIAGCVEDRYGYPIMPEHDVPFEQRVIWLIGSAQGFIEKEGLLRFLALEYDVAGLADAYDVIGMPKLAELLRRLATYMPEPNAEYDADELERLLAESGCDSSFVETTEKEFFEASDSTVRALAEYARRNLERLSGLALALDRGGELGNIGYLVSIWLWSRDFASKNGDLIPMLEGLKGIVEDMHEGISAARSEDYTFLLSGRFSEYPEGTPFVVYNRMLGDVRYCVTVGGSIAVCGERE